MVTDNNYLIHYGVGHLKGGHSGRYPWGSGDRPKQSLEGGSKKLSRKERKERKQYAKGERDAYNDLSYYSGADKYNLSGGKYAGSRYHDTNKYASKYPDLMYKNLTSYISKKTGGRKVSSSYDKGYRDARETALRNFEKLNENNQLTEKGKNTLKQLKDMPDPLYRVKKNKEKTSKYTPPKGSQKDWDKIMGAKKNHGVVRAFGSAERALLRGVDRVNHPFDRAVVYGQNRKKPLGKVRGYLALNQLDHTISQNRRWDREDNLYRKTAPKSRTFTDFGRQLKAERLKTTDLQNARTKRDIKLGQQEINRIIRELKGQGYNVQQYNRLDMFNGDKPGSPVRGKYYRVTGRRKKK